MDYSSPDSSVHRILQARILEWITIPFSRGPSQPRDWTWVSCITGRFFKFLKKLFLGHMASGIFDIWPGIEPTPSAVKAQSANHWTIKEVKVKVAQSCLTLCNPTDYTVHGILRARILEWVAVPFSYGSSQPRDWTQVSCTVDGFFTSWATSESQ